MSLGSRVQGMVLRGKIVAARGVGAGIQRCDVRVLAGDDPADVEQLAQYGFASVPLEGADVVVVAVQGKAEDLVIIAVDDRRHRPSGMQPGDVALYDHRGRQIALRSDRIEVAAPRIDLGAGASKRVARVGDSVAASTAFATWVSQVEAKLSTGTGTVTPLAGDIGAISTGSSVVRAVD